MAVDPRGADLKRYLAEDPGGPVVMLNLLRFAPDGGRERYPSRQAFSDMVRDPEYGTGTHLRTGALEEAVLQATTEWVAA